MSCLSLVCRCTFAVHISYRLYAFPHRQILPGSQTVPASGGLHRRAHLRPPVRVPRRAGQGASSSWCVLIQQSRPGVLCVLGSVGYVILYIVYVDLFVRCADSFLCTDAAFFSAAFLQFHGVPRLFPPPPRASAAPSLTDPCGWYNSYVLFITALFFFPQLTISFPKRPSPSRPASCFNSLQCIPPTSSPIFL